jgi:MFS family permease
MDGALTQEENEAQVDRHLWPARLVQAAFMASILVYGIILGVISVSLTDIQIYDTDDFLGSDPVVTFVGGVLAVAGIAGIALGYFLPHLTARWHRKRAGALLLLHMLRCVLFLVTAIIGLILGVMGAGLAFSVPFLVVAFVALALTFPTKRKWLKMLE